VIEKSFLLFQEIVLHLISAQWLGKPHIIVAKTVATIETTGLNQYLYHIIGELLKRINPITK